MHSRSEIDDGQILPPSNPLVKPQPHTSPSHGPGGPLAVRTFRGIDHWEVAPTHRVVAGSCIAEFVSSIYVYVTTSNVCQAMIEADLSFLYVYLWNKHDLHVHTVYGMTSSKRTYWNL